MSVKIDGTNGLSGVDGSASTPAVQGSDSNTGVFYPAADTVAIGTGGTERMRIDTSGNVGIGLTPSTKLDVLGNVQTRPAATQDAVIVAGRAGGTSSYAVTLTPTTLTANQTLTLPNLTGTVLTSATTSGINGSAISSGTVPEAYGGTGTSTGYYGFKNRIINGAMMIDQRNAGASFAQTNAAYNLDRWLGNSYTGGATTGKYTVQRSTTAPAGFINSLLVTSSAATANNANNIYNLTQPIEGLNIADLAWGTANAKTITLSFYVYSSLTGTFGGSLQNAAQNRSYPFTYTISAANTWEQKTVTIAGDTTGTWGTGTGVGIYVNIGLGVGSTYSGTAGSWAASNYYSATGATSVVGTNGATFYITGVQLEVGSSATSFDYRPYGTELALCQRYYEVFYSGAQGQPISSYYYGSGSNYFCEWYFKQEKRAQATIAKVNGTWTGTTPTIYGGISDAAFYSTGIFYLTTTTGQIAFSASAEL